MSFIDGNNSMFMPVAPAYGGGGGFESNSMWWFIISDYERRKIEDEIHRLREQK